MRTAAVGLFFVDWFSVAQTLPWLSGIRGSSAAILFEREPSSPTPGLDFKNAHEKRSGISCSWNHQTVSWKGWSVSPALASLVPRQAEGGLYMVLAGESSFPKKCNTRLCFSWAHLDYGPRRLWLAFSPPAL